MSAPKEHTRAAAGEQTVWQSCSVNCGCHCPLQLHVQDGRLVWVEGDTLPEDNGSSQMRACLRGRSLRGWLDAPTRLDYPMRRVGARGSGQFERITWDEALDEVAAQLKRIVSTYGNQAVFVPYGTGLYPAEGSSFERLLNAYGGHLSPYGDYSSMQLQGAMNYLYGDDGYYTGSILAEAENADLVIMFGNSPSDTRMGGASAAWELMQARERGRFKLVSIDPRYTATNMGQTDQWIALYPGTDAALVCGLAYVLITEGLVDEEFLRTYCIGYDRDTLPPSAPENASYKDYVLGLGPDATPKTPRWASAITGVPHRQIEDLAWEIGKARRVFVVQGWGPQRCDNGELTARAIPMLAILTGNIGLPGTNSGARERFLPFTVPSADVLENPVKARIPVFEWTAAVERGAELTAENAGVRGADRLDVPVKMIVNHAGNCLINQHSDINRTHRILSDESLCEFIVVCDIHMTSSAKYADILLPDIARAEKRNVVPGGSADDIRSVVEGADWCSDLRERRDDWEVCLELAERLGCRDAFVGQGFESAADMDAWRRTQATDPDLFAPSDDAMGGANGAVPNGTIGGAAGDVSVDASNGEGDIASDGEGGIAPNGESGDALGAIASAQADAGRFARKPYAGERIAYRAFREDPVANPLPTPSGKIEIYSERLAELAEVLERDPDQVIHPLPVYAPSSEGRGSALQEEYPFQLIGFHGQRRVHSCFANVESLDAVAADGLFVNPIDAQRLGIFDRSDVLVSNARGTIRTRAVVIPGIMPGVVALAQGAWYRSEEPGRGVDLGGCINVLTSQRPTPLTRGNPQNSILVRIESCHEALGGALDAARDGADACDVCLRSVDPRAALGNALYAVDEEGEGREAR